MTPREAVAMAKDYVAELFAAEGARNIGLEELRYDEQAENWLVTIGFSRAWEAASGIMSRVDANDTVPPRTFKLIEISDKERRVLDLRHRPIAA